ncbi:GTPase [uncultured Psychroserpens sp.]|uniref:GTPase n=1 Tax=uncultured Psychroserpens sp. TaxID=255436 RepID=UPI0026383EAD|nr:GTPase [uncultured Psychroserpens sp.]
MTLLFVYNANSGKLNTLLDAGHKLLSPKTYQCNLCALTFNTFSENSIWTSFRKNSKIAMVFYHKDEFEAKFPKSTIPYPAILKLEDNALTMLFDNDHLENILSVEDLITQIKSKM